MSLEFKERGKKIVSEKAIFFNGVEVGEISEKEEGQKASRYHAVLNVGVAGRVIHAGIAQGFGETEVEAIEDALRSGETAVREYSLGLERLKALYFQES